jgi:hypothetical protein
VSIGQVVRNRVAATMAVVVIAYLGYHVLIRGEVQDHATFTVTFSPEPRNDGVDILGEVEGVYFAEDLAARSPYIASTWIPKGAGASINATQLRSGKLSCTAHLNGVLVDGPNEREDMGSIRCYVNRRPRR